MDYLLNPLICIIWCSKAAGNVIPEIPYVAWALGFAALFTLLNLRGIKTTAHINEALAAAMGVVIVLFLIAAVRYLLRIPGHTPGYFTHPFYDPKTFSAPAVFTGTSIAVLTYLGFDGISTLSEEAENPRRNILLATVLVCLVTGILASIEVYVAQLVWPTTEFPDTDTAYAFIAGRAGGALLFQIVNFTLLVANVGSGMAAHLAAARLLYGMGRDNAIPKNFFGAVDLRSGIPRNNIIFVGTLALAGALVLSYQLGAELLNFGAFIAFMGVNAAAFTHYFVRRRERSWSNFLMPFLGFSICLFIWLNLRWQAKVAGVVWLAAGIAYGFYKTHGFRKNLSFDVAAE
jgi:amino acid transporter